MVTSLPRTLNLGPTPRLLFGGVDPSSSPPCSHRHQTHTCFSLKYASHAVDTDIIVVDENFGGNLMLGSTAISKLRANLSGRE
eukprot:2561670-Prymnesium_polylepis.1